MSGPVFNSKSTTFQGVCLLGYHCATMSPLCFSNTLNENRLGLLITMVPNTCTMLRGDIRHGVRCHYKIWSEFEMGWLVQIPF